MKIILAFDVFGTLLDTSSFPEEARRKQLEYTWLFTIMGKFLPFREITSMAVRSYLNEHEGSEPQLMEIWRNLKAHGDVSSLAEISSLAEVFALSNGSVEEVREHLERNGILKYFKGIYSAEQVGEYKPLPRSISSSWRMRVIRPFWSQRTPSI
ncbi:HAD hydrolase-like protein [Metallosphaera hakonensis]|uniref:HAD hydrolase-like protein n=1 Tax=Metallosphaera hakonensis TaxID=79601 RepID=UPI000AB720AE|nr:HAD hydrolase-like protein [Metallosphaera hakonensis]